MPLWSLLNDCGEDGAQEVRANPTVSLQHNFTIIPRCELMHTMTEVQQCDDSEMGGRAKDSRKSLELFVGNFIISPKTPFMWP